MGIKADKRMYSAMDNFAKNGYIDKNKDTTVGKKGNIWILNANGKELLEKSADEIPTIKEYEKKIVAYRKANPQPSAKKNYRAKPVQKDLLETPKKPVKAKEPEEDIGLMGAAATAAVDGIAALVEENQRNTALLKNHYIQLHAIFGNQQ